MPSYVNVAMREFRQGQVVLIAYGGADTYAYYSVMGELLKHKPSAVVLVTGVRQFGARGPRYNDLVSMIPEDLVLASLRLPWHGRGMTLPEVLLYRALRWQTVEDAFLRVEGRREGLREAWLPRWRGGDSTGEAGFYGGYAALVRSYDMPFDRAAPAARMLEATVRMAVGRGVRVEVVVPPIPYQLLEDEGRYGPRTRARIADVGEMVGSAGGRFHDLHDFLQRSDFRDAGAHYTADGMRRMASWAEGIMDRYVPRREGPNGR